MKIAAIGQIEDDFILDQVMKQTVQTEQIFYVDPDPAIGIDNRRKRIARNHKYLRKMVEQSEAEYVWQVEGDAVLEPDTLERLIYSYQTIHDPKKAYVSGIQVGRHGIYALGAWHIAEDHKSFESLDHNLQGLQRVDATGFYCLFGRKEDWLKGTASWNDERWGPDVVWGLSLKKLGYNIYVDMNIKVGHKALRGTIHPDHLSTCNVRFWKDNHAWKYKTT